MPDLDDTAVAEIATSAPTPVIEPIADDFDKDRAMATIEKLRLIEKNAKVQAKELAELKAEREQRATAELSETERLKKQLADALARETAAASRLQAELVKSAAQSAALALQTPFASADALSDAVALGAFASLEIGDDGKVTGINDAIKALHKQRPYLFGKANQDAPDINAGARGAGARTNQEVIDAQAAELRRSGRYGGF
jgi:hypothetical protein